MHLPEKTVERLSQYRRVLFNALQNKKFQIYSHELAALLHITSVQVRRDIMLIGYSGTQRKGYDVKELINLISIIIDSEQPQNVAIIGAGNLGRAIIGYLKDKRAQLNIIASFDNNPNKFNRMINGVYCYASEMLTEIIRKNNISIGIITVPAEYATETADSLIKSGIKGILNYTPTPLKVPSHVYLEEYDMLTSLEKVSYFVKQY